MSAPGASPPAFSAEEQALLEQGVAQWNARLFFECHDTLEELWTALHDERREFVQGLIQLAVAFYHLGNGNRAGAVRLFERGLERLRRYPERYAGLETGRLREAAALWHEAAAGGGALPPEGPPSIRIAVAGRPPVA